MDNEEGMECCQFVGTARTSHAAFRQHRFNNSNNNNRNQDRTPTRPTPGTTPTANAGAVTTGQ